MEFRVNTGEVALLIDGVGNAGVVRLQAAQVQVVMVQRHAHAHAAPVRFVATGERAEIVGARIFRQDGAPAMPLRRILHLDRGVHA